MFSISLNVAFCKSKINDENFVTRFIESNAKVIRLDIPVNEVPIMNVLNSGDQLINQHQHCFLGELPKSVFKQTFERRTHKIHDQNVIVT